MRTNRMNFLQRAIWGFAGQKTAPSAERKHSGSYESSALNIRPLTTIEALRRATIFLRPYKSRAFANIFFAILSLGFTFAFPQLTQYIIDDVLSGKTIETLLPSVL